MPTQNEIYSQGAGFPSLMLPPRDREEFRRGANTWRTDSSDRDGSALKLLWKTAQ